MAHSAVYTKAEYQVWVNGLQGLLKSLLVQTPIDLTGIALQESKKIHFHPYFIVC
jgi:hypothetical protein